MQSKNHIPRDVLAYIFDEQLIGRHMVFLAGPRQVGKTHLARTWLAQRHCNNLYYNWDDIKVRRTYLADSRFFESDARMTGLKDPWIVFDEIHKRTRWRDILKGAYDIFADEFRFLVTGSARLDLFRKSGDSLVGRYNLFHMMPLCIREVIGKKTPYQFLTEPDADRLRKIFSDMVTAPVLPEVEEGYQNLLMYGPFPEPFLKQNSRFCRKWHLDYISLLLREDLRDISRVAALDKIEHLVALLPKRVASPLSMANIAREIEVAHTTVKLWLGQLKRLYLVFPVAPWSKNVARGLKKEKKWYFLNWHYAPDGAAKIENMVASCLYRCCKVLTDQGYGRYRLQFLRTLDKKEIDFVVCRDEKPVLVIEVKTSATAVSKSLLQREKYFVDSPTIGVQLVDKRNVLKKYDDCTWVMSVERLLALLA